MHQLTCLLVMKGGRRSIAKWHFLARVASLSLSFCLSSWAAVFPRRPLTLFLLLLCYLSESVSGGPNERRLLNDLMANYNNLERPVANESEPLIISFGVTLQQIIDVDEKNQLLITNLWLRFEWIDANLRWVPSDYGGVSDLRIPSNRLWKPDILMYNSADERFDSTYQTNVVVKHNGSCLYIPPGIFKSSCKIDITWFPFDDQLCEMKFGSWTYDGWTLDLRLNDDKADLSDYIPSGEWLLVGVPAIRNEKFYACCLEPFIDVTFTVHLRRKTLYYGFNLIIPCCIISSIALLGFTLPPESGEKLTLGVTILLSLSVFMLQLSEVLPATSDAVSIIGTYFASIMMMVAFSVVMTVLVLNFHYKSSEAKELSPFAKKILLIWLPRILRMDVPGQIRAPKNKPADEERETYRNVKQNSRNIFTTFADEGQFNRGQCACAHETCHCSNRPTNCSVKHCSSCSCCKKTNTCSNTPSNTCSNNQMCTGHSRVIPGTQRIHQAQVYPCAGSTSTAVHSIGHSSKVGRRICEMDSCVHSTIGVRGGVHHGSKCTTAGRGGELPDLELSKLSSRGASDVYIRAPHEASVNCHCSQCNSLGHSSAIYLSSASGANVDPGLLDSRVILGEIELEEESSLSGSSGSGVGVGAVEASSSAVAGAASNYCHHCCHHQNQLDCHSEVDEILTEMKFITNRMRREDESNDIVMEYRLCALVIDRCCLYLFTTVTVISTLLCISKAPHLIV